MFASVTSELIPSHRSLEFQISTTQKINGENIVRAFGLTSRAGNRPSVQVPEGSSLVAERCFPQATTLFETPLAGWVVVFRICRALVDCDCVAWPYLLRLSADQLRLECSVRGLSCCGPVRELRRRLAEFLRRSVMERFELQHDTQASVPAGVLNTGFDPPPPPHDEGTQCTCGISQTPVLVDLLKQVEPLLSERPEDILLFFVRLGELHALGLVDDRVFMTRNMPRVPGGLLQFLGDWKEMFLTLLWL